MKLVGQYCCLFFFKLAFTQACPFLCNCIFSWHTSGYYQNIWHCGHQGISNKRFDLITKDQNISDVHSLYLDGNKLNDLDTSKFKGFSKLKTLSLVENSIASFPSSICKDLPSLETINLTNNSIDSITSDSFMKCNGLKDLNLSGNRIHLLGQTLFLSLGKLRKLDLSQNDIHKLSTKSLDGLQSLTELDLSNNKIKEIPKDVFNGIHNILSLDVSNNDIVFLNKDTFKTLNHLKYLNLSQNSITQLEKNTFKKLNFDFLDLSFNKIEQIKTESFVDAIILSLNLIGNPVLCDCSLKSLIVFPGENETRKVPIASNIDGVCSFLHPKSVLVSIQNLTSTLYCGFQCSQNETCKNEGTCLMQQSATRYFFYQQCDCKNEFIGTFCEERIRKKSKSKATLVIIIIVGIPLLVLFAGLLIFWRQCQRRHQKKSDMYPLTDDDFSL